MTKKEILAALKAAREAILNGDYAEADSILDLMQLNIRKAGVRL